MGRPTKHEQWRKAIGAKVTKLTPDVLHKLKEAFAIDCTVAQACVYAEISERTYYNWTEKNPELLQEFQEMKQKLPLKAKHNIAQRIHAGDVLLSERYLSKKEPDQYGDKLKIEHSGAIGGSDTPLEDKEATEAYYRMLKENAQKRNLAKASK